MSKFQKLLLKLKLSKNTFPWKDTVILLEQLNYIKKEMAGSRVRFYNKETDSMILLHKPHPENEIKGGALKSLKQTLQRDHIL